jgi:uncharacterized protein YjbI with pentapeptide repeats
MKRFSSILLALATILSAHAQKAPILHQKLESNGELTLAWAVQIVSTASTNLNARYQLEFANELGAWEPYGGIIPAEETPQGLALVSVKDALTRPASFFRIRATLDYSGGNFLGKTLADAFLVNATFTGANFLNAHLDRSAFDNADLAAADFRFATMTQISATNADFTLARLADADLTSANLAGATLVLAELSGAKLTFADLTGADLRGAVLQDMDTEFTRFHKTIIDPNTIFDRRTLALWLIVNGKAAGRTFTDVDLSFADLSGGNLANAQLPGLDLSAADLRDVDLSGANLTNATLRLLDLRGTKIDDATIIATKWRAISDIINNPRANRSHQNTDLSLALWIDATLEAADVRSSNFTLGIVDNMNFENAKASFANFSSVEFHTANFKNADLHNATFANSILENVTFLGANTTNVNFNGATFRNTTLSNGTIRKN